MTDSAESAAEGEAEIEGYFGSVPKVFKLIEGLGLPKEVKKNLDRALLAAKGLAAVGPAALTEEKSTALRAHYKKELKAAFRGLLEYSEKMLDIAKFVKYWAPAIETELITPATAQQASGKLFNAIVVSIFGVGVVILGPIVNSKEVVIVGLLISIYGVLSATHRIK